MVMLAGDRPTGGHVYVHVQVVGELAVITGEIELVEARPEWFDIGWYDFLFAAANFKSLSMKVRYIRSQLLDRGSPSRTLYPIVRCIRVRCIRS